MIGIYKITNKINNHCYIGQSMNIFYRWVKHMQNYQKGDRGCILYLAIEKYGIENFTFEILEECEEKELDEKELFYIEKFNTYQEGYNATIGGCGWRKVDQDTINKIVQLWTNGFTTLEICEKVGATKHTVLKYLKEYTDYTIEEANRRGATFMATTKRKPIIQTDLEGNILNEFPSIKNACAALQINYHKLHKILEEEEVFDNKWKFKYKNNYYDELTNTIKHQKCYKIVAQLPNGEEKLYPSKYAAYTEHHLSSRKFEDFLISGKEYKGIKFIYAQSKELT